MSNRSKQIPQLFAFFALASSGIALAQTQAPSPAFVAPLAASAPTVVPALVPFSGVVLDRDGHALTGETGMTFLIYKDQTGGEPLFTETQSVLPDATGHYSVHLGSSMSSGIPLDLFSSGEARWLEVQTAGQRPQARVLLVSVPYALKAADAATLGGLPASAFALAAPNAPPVYKAGVTSAAITPAVAPAISGPQAATTVTTTGGTANYVAKYSGASTIVNSLIYDSGLNVGIGTTSPTAKLTVAGTTTLNGTSTLNGSATFAAQGTATATKSYNSQSILLNTSAFNSSTAAVVAPRFQLTGEVTGNDTAAPNATLNVLASTTSSAPAETGLYINTNGIIHFATGQTFPGAGGSGGSFCIASGGGFGSGGTTYVAPSLTVPAANNCSSWNGFTKTAGTVILTTSGSACLSTDSKSLTVSVSGADPAFLGAGTLASDYIVLTRTGTTGSFTTGSDQGYFSGSADQITCTSSLLQLPATHD
jgi:hypothetical protein